MPTVQQLRRAGRGDLAYGISLHGHAAVCRQLQLPLRARGLVKNRLKFAHVAGALLAGCRTPSKVLRHLQAERGYAVARSYLNQRMLDWCAAGRMLRFKHGHYCLPAHTVLRLRRGWAGGRCGGGRGGDAGRAIRVSRRRGARVKLPGGRVGGRLVGRRKGASGGSL
jgi:hypothetical protein